MSHELLAYFISMVKTKKITYKVFLFERVKKKVKFFDTETYPLQIRITAGTRTVYLKSYFFSILQQYKYQQEMAASTQKISINDIIVCEQKLMDYLLSKEDIANSPDLVRQQYHFLSRDLLQELDDAFKTFLIDFFMGSNLPAYALFLENDGRNYTSEFILKNLEESLQPSMYKKLLQSAVVKAPPYIPLMRFFREKINTALPVLPVYLWQQEPVYLSFVRFAQMQYPEYERPGNYINRLLGIHQNSYLT